MPEFGRAHRLLGAIHLDTEPPAAGADPSDGQVATWSAALKAWIAADPTGAVGMEQHGDEYHQGRIVDAGTSFPDSPEDGEQFYRTDLKRLYLYQT